MKEIDIRCGMCGAKIKQETPFIMNEETKICVCRDCIEAMHDILLHESMTKVNNAGSDRIIEIRGSKKHMI